MVPPVHCALQLGCPRQRFLAINSVGLPDFLQAGYYEVYAQYIKKLEARLDKLKRFFYMVEYCENF